MSNIDMEAIRRMFDDLDVNGNGTLDFEEFSTGLVLGVGLGGLRQDWQYG